MRRLLVILLATTGLGLSAGTALASDPLLVSTTPAAGATGQDRYRPAITFTYDQPVTVSGAPTLQRVATGVFIPITVEVSGNSVTLRPDSTLASGQEFRAVVQPDGATAPDQIGFSTRPAPAHSSLRVRIITALDDAAVQDIVHRLDRSNLLAVPRPEDLLDISLAGGRALTSADLAGYQAALVVTDRDIAGQDAAAGALAGFATNGHGVVLGGQTHWKPGPLWSAASAISTNYQSGWATTWSPFGLTNPIAVQGGTLAGGSVANHFLTRYLSSFQVIGPGSGEITTQNLWNCAVLARLQTTAAFSLKGQVLVATRQSGKGRVVDLGFRPWSNDIAGGGYDPDVSSGGGLVARSLWWATNRIPPSGTRFTAKPANPSPWRSVQFRVTAGDPDDSHLRYRYRVNNGLWKWAPSSTFTLYYLTAGKTYTVRTYAVDQAGNRDPHTAAYTFRIAAGAR